jgi:4-hydroxyproline epimerase
MVGALLCEPFDKRCATGVIFFNNVGYLGMCGHGTIGLLVTLAHLGKIRPGENFIETPVGVVSARLNDDGSVSLDTVPSYRKSKDVRVDLGGGQVIIGDVAWGGNWFFLTDIASLDPTMIEALTAKTWKIRQALNAGDYPEIDHIEVFGRGKNFVLCPGKAYDRSPCGTGTSAKVACLAADGKLAEGETWIQESIIGSKFKATYRWFDRAKGVVVPTITGNASVNSEATLILDERDPFCWGIR